MKSIIITLLVLTSLFSFGQQIENPGFETWEEIGLGPDILEPVNWSSIKTSDDPDINDFAPIAFEKSTDAHSGQYSVKLYNVTLLGLNVAGTLSNGQYHADFNPDLGYTFTNPDDPKWNTPFNTRPDSIAFWMKFFPVGDDTLQFQALLHVDEGTLPPQPQNEANQVAYTRTDIPGTHENWTRIFLAFDYCDDRDPEYLLMILTSGNGTTPVVGSYALFDDLEIIDDQQSIVDNPLEQVNIFIRDNNLYIKNLPEDLLKNTNIEILDLTGRVIWKDKIYSDEIALPKTSNSKGMYIVRINSLKYSISKKVNF